MARAIIAQMPKDAYPHPSSTPSTASRDEFAFGLGLILDGLRRAAAIERP